LVKQIVGYAGELITDPTKPDGTPRKTMDVSRLFGLGWRPQISVKEAFESSYQWFLAHEAEARKG
jgi:GDP-L-fucose synthase